MNIKILNILLLLFLIIVACIVYWPGLSGEYIFDDMANLVALATIDNTIDLVHLKTYFAESTSGPLKRPISILSFLIDAQTWPADPWPFKRTNLIIHILNGLLLYLLLYRVFLTKNIGTGNVLIVSFFSSAIWLLHPFMVSTTLYIVQRMAMLPLLFVLIGMLSYFYGRMFYRDNKMTQAKLCLFIGVYVATSLAVLSKENGALMFLYIALFELFVCRKYLALPRMNKSFRILFTYVPVILITLLFIALIPKFTTGFDTQPFTMVERLLTEGRVLVLYLSHIVFPSHFTEGVFGNGLVVSTGLFQPITTFFSWIFLFSLLVFVWLVRNRYVWLSFAIFFYFIAHLFESTIIPLELYFEHRNYLASIFLPVPLVLLIVNKIRPVAIIVLFGILVFLAFNAFVKASIWGDNIYLHEKTIQTYPDSVRARVFTALLYENTGDRKKALEVIEQGLILKNDLRYHFNLLILQCSYTGASEQNFNTLIIELKTKPLIKWHSKSFVMLMNKISKNECGFENPNDKLKELIEAYLDNSEVKSGFMRPMGIYLKAEREMLDRNYQTAVNLYIDSFKLSADYEGAFSAVVKLINHSAFQQAQDLLNIVKSSYTMDFKFRVDWNNLGETLKYLQIKVNEETQK